MNEIVGNLVVDYKEINELNYIFRSVDKIGFGWIVILFYIIICVF